jgi:hypothetical protein
MIPWELELLICGDSKCPVSRLKKYCKTNKAASRTVEMLWAILEQFSTQERMLFIKFSSGRMGLPPPGCNWTSQISIETFDNNLPDEKKPLPHSNDMQLSNYNSQLQTIEWFEKKLRAAILLVLYIVLDGT